MKARKGWFYPKLLFFLCCTSGWYRSMKLFRRLVNEGSVAGGDEVILTVTLKVSIPDDLDKTRAKDFSIDKENVTIRCPNTTALDG